MKNYQYSMKLLAQLFSHSSKVFLFKKLLLTKRADLIDALVKENIISWNLGFSFSLKLSLSLSLSLSARWNLWILGQPLPLFTQYGEEGNCHMYQCMHVTIIQ
ncbi:hypothetical protein SO802_031740 [Lithocarpus litseifolius]|uniref:Uncharacterized protein n=1 Tax=Lithocarpus litseifolius TaxID=425828 RepID=A0AAW2BPF2_9ROSI